MTRLLFFSLYKKGRHSSCFFPPFLFSLLSHPSLFSSLTSFSTTPLLLSSPSLLFPVQFQIQKQKPYYGPVNFSVLSNQTLPHRKENDMSAHTIVVVNPFSLAKDESSLPASASPNIDIPATARSAIVQANAISPPLTPPLLSTSASSSISFDSLPAVFDIDATSSKSVLSEDVVAEAGAVAVAGGASDVRSRRLSQQFFFPNQTVFECAVPKITRARDLHLADHPIKEGEFAEYERLYNADSLMTVDGRHMVRLL